MSLHIMICPTMIFTYSSFINNPHLQQLSQWLSNSSLSHWICASLLGNKDASFSQTTAHSSVPVPKSQVKPQKKQQAIMILTFTADKMVHLEDFRDRNVLERTRSVTQGRERGLIARGECAKNKKKTNCLGTDVSIGPSQIMHLKAKQTNRYKHRPSE